ncbi:MAG: tRNA nucleotidyltransferase, partial [Mariprofundaceae bacterium]
MQPDADAIPAIIREIAAAIRDAGGRAYLVGGPVRDLLLGLKPQDFDLEVFGLDARKLRETAAAFGRCKAVGRAFGVLKLALPGMEVDLALPRRERKTAPGHRGFDIAPDPGMSPQAASRRRDFTINAMMLDPLSGELLDFHGGRRDLERRVLRHVSPAFAEDPLRVLRGMQFAARFRLALAPETARLCAALRAEAA